MSRNTFAEVIAAAQRVVDLVHDGSDIVGFDEKGNGPINCIADHSYNGPGPIRRATDILRQKLLDHEAAERAKGAA